MVARCSQSAHAHPCVFPCAHPCVHSINPSPIHPPIYPFVHLLLTRHAPTHPSSVSVCGHTTTIMYIPSTPPVLYPCPHPLIPSCRFSPPSPSPIQASIHLPIQSIHSWLPFLPPPVSYTITMPDAFCYHRRRESNKVTKLPIFARVREQTST